jgi:hypothetical protein
MLENQSSSARQVTCDSAMTAHPWLFPRS